MARSLKPQRVEEYKHGRLGASVDLMLDRNDYNFFFILAGKTYREKSKDALRALAHRTIEATYDLEWQPVIKVERLMPFAMHNAVNAPFVGFTASRFHIAKKHDGEWMSYNHYNWEELDLRPKSEWISMSGSFAGKGFELYKDGQNHRGDRSYVIEYTPDLWIKLQMIVGRISELRDRLDDLMITREGTERLKSMTLPGLLLGGGD